MANNRSRSRTPPRRSYRKRESRHRHRKSKRDRRHRSISSLSSLSTTSSRSRSTPRFRYRSAFVKDRPVDPPPTTCLGVFGLSQFTQESTLMTVFSSYGPIEKAMIVYDAKTKSSRGFGFVYFRTLEDASAAKVQCNGMSLHDRTIRVDYSVTERPHTPTPGVYMGEQDLVGRSHRSSYSYRGRSYDDDYHHGRRSKRSCSSKYHRCHSSRHRRHKHRRSITRSRTRSWTRSTAD